MKIKSTEILTYILIFVIIIFLGAKQIAPITEQVNSSKATKTQKEASIEELKAKASSIDLANSQLNQQKEILKPFYKPEVETSETIASFGGMFEDIVDYIRVNQLLLRSIKYNINPESDPIFNKFSQNYNVCEIQLYVIGTYPQLRNFVQSVFAYPYYTNISSIEINPYAQNKKYLLANISINLYSEKIGGGGNNAPQQPAPEGAPTPPQQ